METIPISRFILPDSLFVGDRCGRGRDDLLYLNEAMIGRTKMRANERRIVIVKLVGEQ